MADVSVIGVGQTAFGAFPERSYRDLFAAATAAARDRVGNGFELSAVDEAVVGTLGVGGRQLGLPGPAVTEHVGLHGVPCTRVENACAAGGYALRQGVQAIESGYADVVLVGGVEVMTDLSADVTKFWLGVSGETEYERLTGSTFAGVYAQLADVYLDRFEATPEDLGRVAVKNHHNGARNPKAHLDFECSLSDAVEATPVASPLNLYHCCPTSDGAAVAILARSDLAGAYTDEHVGIAGVGAASDSVGLADRDTFTGLPASRSAAELAYDRADVEPADLDFAEVHDCFAIAELLAYEDLGFCDQGDAATLVRDGVTAADGDLPVNPSGGLKSKGHPIGATGVGQVVEAVDQLTGRAGDRQLDDPALGLTHNVGGSGGAAVVHVLEREVGA
jgi:acetyl-CoA C-acetyltransferase